MKRQIDNTTPGEGGGDLTGGDLSRALRRKVNLDTKSSDNSAEEIRESGSSFQSLIVWGKAMQICIWYLKCQGVLIPTMPIFWDKVWNFTESEWNHSVTKILFHYLYLDFLAHLSLRLTGKLIVYPCSGVRPSSVCI